MAFEKENGELAYRRIDAHVHSDGVSFCSHVSAENLIERKIAEGYDGVILTNHCQPWYYPPGEHAEYVRKVLAEYRKAKKYGDSLRFKVFLGLEVSISSPAYNDWLLYGVTEKFLADTPCLYALDQRELYELCCAGGVALVQAHPFRNSGWGIEKYMHGTEINCTPNDLERADEVLALARKRGLLVTCGTDYHGDPRPVNGGIYLPASIEDEASLAAYLLSAKETRLFLSEKDFTAPGFKKK